MQPLNSCTMNKNDAQKREKAGPKRTLSVEEEFFLVLCRCKVGLLEEDLAARFGISQGLVTRIIVTWTKFMYYRFKELEISLTGKSLGYTSLNASKTSMREQQ